MQQQIELMIIEMYLKIERRDNQQPLFLNIYRIIINSIVKEEDGRRKEKGERSRPIGKN